MDSCILVKLPAGSFTYLMQLLLLSWLVVPPLGQFCELPDMETGFWWKSSSDTNIVFKKDRHHKSGVRGIHTLTSLYSVSKCVTVFPVFHFFPAAKEARAEKIRPSRAIAAVCQRSEAFRSAMTRGWPDAALDWRHMDGSWFRDEWPKGRRSDVKAAAPARGHSVRVLARLRPFLDNEEEPSDIPCLRTVGSSQLEVLLEPRALLTDTTCRRGRRRTIGDIFASRVALAIAMEGWDSDKLPAVIRKPWEIFQHCVQQRVTLKLLANEAPEEPDASFFKLLEQDGAQKVFATLDVETRKTYQGISHMELAAFCHYARKRAQRRSGADSTQTHTDDSSSEEETDEDAFDALSDEETWL
eukprot:s2249_g2.t1